MLIRTAKQPAPPAPAMPTVGGITTTSVTLMTIPGVEYRVNSGAWQSSPVFSGLEPNTEYMFYVRLAETTTTLSSLPSQNFTVITNSVADLADIPITGERQDVMALGIVLLLIAALFRFICSRRRKENFGADM